MRGISIFGDNFNPVEWDITEWKLHDTKYKKRFKLYWILVLKNTPTTEGFYVPDRIEINFIFKLS